MLPFVDPNQFSSVQVEISLQNTTTQTELRNGKKFMGGKQQRNAFHEDWSILLTEFLEKGVILDVPPNVCSQGHNLMLEFEVAFPDKRKAVFHTTAKAEKVERTDSSRVSLTANFVQFEEEQWKEFKAAFNQRQDEILQFLDDAKG